MSPSLSSLKLNNLKCKTCTHYVTRTRDKNKEFPRVAKELLWFVKWSSLKIITVVEWSLLKEVLDQTLSIVHSALQKWRPVYDRNQHGRRTVVFFEDRWSALVGCRMLCTVEKGYRFSRPQQGRVWLMTSRLGTRKSLTFFYSVAIGSEFEFTQSKNVLFERFLQKINCCRRTTEFLLAKKSFFFFPFPGPKSVSFLDLPQK